MSREALVLLVCCCDFRDGAERLIPSKSLRNAVIRAFPGLFRILRMCAPRRAVAVVRPRGREKSADRRRRILISRLLIIRASVPRRKSPFPAYFKGFPAVSPLIPPYPAFLKYPVSPHPFNEQLYAQFWPISTETGAPGVFLNQCSGAKMAPTALLTHVKQPMLKRRSREIASEGVIKAQEWIGGQDKPVVESKILAFQNALNTCTSRQELDSVLAENIRPCSFRPFVNSNALLWGTIFDYQAGIGGGGARVRPEIKAVYDLPDTVGFSLAHAPKDLDESLGQFTSFCWYFPDNDLSRRGNGHIYLNHYIRDVHTNAVINNIHQSLIERYSALTGLDDSECAKKMVFYSYAVFCSQVYLEEFYGALFVVNQSESRARIPIVDDAGLFLRLAELGERLAILEKNDAAVDNVLDFNYDELLAQMWTGFHLEHSRSASRSPYDEENEQLIVRDEVTGNSIRIYCPVSLQKFTIAGYNVIKDCWLKFHSYRFTHCDFTRDDLKELLDLFNKIASQMGIVSEIDEIMHSIVGGEVALLNYND